MFDDLSRDENEFEKNKNNSTKAYFKPINYLQVKFTKFKDKKNHINLFYWKNDFNK